MILRYSAILYGKNFLNTNIYGRKFKQTFLKKIYLPIIILYLLFSSPLLLITLPYDIIAGFNRNIFLNNFKQF